MEEKWNERKSGILSSIFFFFFPNYFMRIWEVQDGLFKKERKEKDGHRDSMNIDVNSCVCRMCESWLRGKEQDFQPRVCSKE